MSLSPSILCRVSSLRELVYWQCKGWWQESGHGKKKKPHSLREGKAKEGTPWVVWHRRQGGREKTQLAGTRKVSALERARWDWSGWRKKEPGEGGDRDWSGQNKIKKQVRGTHSLMSNCPGHGKKGGQSASGQYMGKASEYGTHQWNAPRAMWHWEQQQQWQLWGKNASGQDTGRKQVGNALTCSRGRWYHSRGL